MSTIKKIIVCTNSSSSSSSSMLSMSEGFNINAKPFYPKGEKERIKKSKLAKIEEDKYYDNLEKIWWQQNKNMFIDSLADSKWFLTSLAKNEIKLKPMVVIEEVVPEVLSPSWADIVKK